MWEQARTGSSRALIASGLHVSLRIPLPGPDIFLLSNQISGLRDAQPDIYIWHLWRHYQNLLDISKP